MECFAEFGRHMVGKAFTNKQPLIVRVGKRAVKEEVEVLAAGFLRSCVFATSFAVPADPPSLLT